MTSKEMEMEERFNTFERQLPDKIIIRNGGPNGQDLILPKGEINGVIVYSVDLEVPLWGISSSKQ